MPAIRSALVVTVVLIATGTYFDDAPTRLTTEMQITYEDHIADLRAQVDRIMSRKFLDQKRVEQQLKALLQRQATLEQHTSALTDDLSATGSIKFTPTAPPAEAVEKTARPSPINETQLHSPELPVSAPRLAERSPADGLNGMLASVSVSLDKIEHKQAAALTELEERIDTKARNMRSVLADLGVDTAKARGDSATGGPLVSIKPPQPGASTFERQLYRINIARLQIESYAHALVAMPVRKPVIGEVEMTSPFGMRMNPFLGRPAIHTGIDLRGDAGEPVRATATGSVTIAGRLGGYGNLVEINHGNGLATRYGHLSEIDVKIGQIVRIGEVIGKIGSTGRSTGPHLHYETRINGEAVDPKKFLRAGLWLGNV
jgi:murein DD-endopeptidase MepM/ murein hydrolase activator NlpD